MTENSPGRLFAVVSTFQPSVVVADRIGVVARQVEHVVVVVDDSDPQKLKALRTLTQSNVTVLPFEGNVGVARVLNVGAAASCANDNDLLLFLDDDTDLHQTYGTKLLDELSQSGVDVSRHIFGPSVIHLGDFCALNKPVHGHLHAYSSNLALLEKRGVISSGMLVRKSLFDELGGFDETLFIDSVDYDFCLRAATLGITTLQLRRHYIIHQLGNTTQHRVFGLEFKTTNHSPLRRRYYVRNSCRLAWRYRAQHPLYGVAVVVHHLKTASLVMFFEKNRFTKLRCMLAGYSDFLSRRTGRIDLPRVDEK